MDTFHGYLKKQLLEYVESERKKGIPLEQIEKVTQKNTANASEIAVTAEELDSQSEKLKEMLSQFKLKNRDTQIIRP